MGFFGGKKQSLRFKQTESSPPASNGRSGRIQTSGNSKFIVWGIAAVTILIVLFSIFSLFEKATIRVTSKQQIAPINTQLSAQRGTTTTGGLVFEIMTLSGEEKKTLPATQVERVDRQAFGKIII